MKKIRTAMMVTTVTMAIAIAADAVTITNKTDFGNGADATVSESDNVSGGSGLGGTINARWAPGSLRNEYIFLRFDFSMITAGTVSNASLNLTAFRADTSRTLTMYGLNDDAAGQSWDEASITFSNAPALSFDANSTTRGRIDADLTSIGNAASPTTKGEVLSFTGTGSNLVAFINADTDGLVTFLVERETDSSGQTRFASKEATSLDAGTPSGSVGYFAPYLVFDAMLGGIPLLANATASGVTSNSALLNGYLTSTGSSATVVGVLWGSTDMGTNQAAWANTNWFGTNLSAVPPSVLYSTNISVLSQSNAYYYRFLGINDDGVTLASPSEVFITGAVWVEATDPSGHEDGELAVFTVYRPNLATNLALDVNYALSGTASNGLDYEALPDTVSIPAGALSATVTVNPIADGLMETNETVVLTLETGPYCIGALSSASITITNNPNMIAFYGAEGSGRWSKGGRGGDVYIVTNLNDSGAGSLRDAVTASGPRTVVFEVSGTIYLASGLSISNPNITIAGQTAPGDGICLANYQFRVSASDVILRFLRFRAGDEMLVETDCVWIESGTNIIMDHCSASWSVDETLSTSDNADMVTVQWCMITESLNNSVHPKGAHGMAALVRGHHGASVTYHHNLFAHHVARSPRPGNYEPYTTDPEGFHFDFRNNVIYNWAGSRAGYNADTDSVSKYNFINNYYVRGPNTPVSSIAFNESCSYARAYFAGNWMQHAQPGDPWSLVSGNTGGSYKQSQPFDSEYVTTETAPVAYSNVLNYAGASHARDSVDSRAVSDVLNITGSIINDEMDVGGWPTLNSTAPRPDTDRDGMPDDWELARNLTPNDASDRNGDRLGDGYSNLEEYINGIAYGPLLTIEVSDGAHGTLSPTSGFSIGYGFSTNIVIAPDTFWHIDQILVDGTPQPLTNSLGLTDVVADHQVSALFAADLTTNQPTPLWWLDAYGLTDSEVAVTNDIDSDGMEAWAEYIAGTDPTNSESAFRILDFESGSVSNHMTWYGTTNSGVVTPFSIYCNSNLLYSSWSFVTNVPRAATGTNTWWFTTSVGDSRVFYRITATNSHSAQH